MQLEESKGINNENYIKQFLISIIQYYDLGKNIYNCEVYQYHQE